MAVLFKKESGNILSISYFIMMKRCGLRFVCIVFMVQKAKNIVCTMLSTRKKVIDKVVYIYTYSAGYPK